MRCGSTVVQEEVPFALWVIADFFDGEQTVPRFEENFISLKPTLHFPNSSTT